MAFPQDKPEILTYFEYTHLPPQLAAVSKPFCELAYNIATIIPDGEQRQVALHYLLLAKDAAVRASLPHGRSHI